MPRRTLLLPLLVAALALPTAAGSANNPNLIKLKIGDAVDVVGTKVACFAINSNGKDGVACVLWGAKKPLVNTYGVGLAVDGTAVVNRMKKDGSAVRLFKKRLPASRHASGSTYRVKVGEGFGLPAKRGEILGCQVMKITSTSVEPIYRGIKVSCWFATATSAVPNRYGVSISDRFAGVFRITPQGKISTWGYVKKQPQP